MNDREFLIATVNAAATFVMQRKLSLKQAQDLALKALASAEERRQREREAEAKYWADLE